MTRAKTAVRLVALWILAGRILTAQAGTPAPPEPGDLAAFMDGIVETVMRSHALPGMVVTVVDREKVLLSRGYGFADVDGKVSVSPENTRFRTGSTGKLFTWTAVMQLVETGRIDLDTDINTYLGEGLRIPDTFPEPITMAHLMSHTSGFEDRVMGMAVKDSRDLIPLKDWLETHMPARVRPPGILTAYSNYGCALAGYIVERVSGIAYEDYLRQRIFTPLGMSRTTCRQPPRDEGPLHTATPYRFHDSWHEKRPFAFLNGMVPAGAHSTTAADMARFMMAHLREGELEGRRILETATARRMHAHLFSHAPGLPGNAHGFWEYHILGRRVIAHSGDTLYFHTLMALVPDAGVGLFLSTHSSGRYGNPRLAVLESFIRRYFARIQPTAPGPDTFTGDPARFCGSYRVTRSAYTTFEKVFTLFSAFTVNPGKEGRLVLSGGGRVSRWLPVAPLRFRSPDGRDHLQFRENSRGDITHMFIERIPHAALEKLSPLQSPGLHLFFLGFGLILFGITFIRWPGRWILGRICPSLRDEHSDGISGLPRWMMGLVSLLYLTWVLGMAIIFSTQTEILYGPPAGFSLLQWLPLVAAALTAGTILAAVSAWTARRWSVCSRIYATLFALAAGLFTWVLWVYNLLGFRY